MSKNLPDFQKRAFTRRTANSLAGCRVTALGLGTLGGAVEAVKFLAAQGAIVTVTDEKPASKLAASLAELAQTPIHRFVLGGHDDDDFRKADLIVANPAVRPDHRLLKLARDGGIPITTEVQLFLERCPAPVAAVTGSNGKSTTTAMLHRICEMASGSPGLRRAWLGGNIGVSLLDQLPAITSDDLVVMELSSFQLYWLNQIEWSPNIAIVTNFSANHLDWHDGLDDYRSAKQTMFRWQHESDVAVINLDDPDVRQWPGPALRLGFQTGSNCSDVTTKYGVFSESKQEGYSPSQILRLPHAEIRLPVSSWLQVRGVHNLQNAMAALAAASVLDLSIDVIETALRSYQALPHRLEFVGACAGREFYNDSLATTPESAILGLKAFSQPVILLAGGYDKGVDLSSMSKVISQTCRMVVLMGQTAPAIHEQIEQYRPSGGGPEVFFASSPHDAFTKAWENSQPGDVILLSPGCASYDWFVNFRDRGEQFRQFVRGLAKTHEEQ